MKKLKDFKSEFNLVNGHLDVWGGAMEAWFECAGQMNKRHLPIPLEWQYKPALGTDGTDQESYWFELFENCSDELLIEIGNLLTRYCQYLKYKKVDY